ncbi:hypothetical protein [Collimonas pratensis]|uniref:Uncharacterized protein n=1 Tax=Collimonas pratensis TaxID=279113 RepID=A0A127Q736_9BURK|nr:hypothetical protein [Collimonas pratensis]AMP05635.1 hypothetical protein CPter91_3308 [Collimonas pratensis]
MMSEDSKRLDDAEFEAFLQGHGELARQLQGLPQPSPSAALDAAILAQAETLLKTATPLPQAANDALSGKAGKPAKPRFLMRWSTQLGMAACMVLAVLATLRWQTEPATQSYDTAPPAEPAPPPPASAAAPSEKSLEPVEKKAQAKPELVRPKAITRSARRWPKPHRKRSRQSRPRIRKPRLLQCQRRPHLQAEKTTPFHHRNWQVRNMCRREPGQSSCRRPRPLPIRHRR